MPPARADRTRAALLDAAEALFSQRGYEATRLEDVAARVGIRRASIVYHFSDKAQLYEAVLARLLEALRSALEDALDAGGDPRRRTLDAVGAWVDFLAERPAFARLLLRETASSAPDGPPSMAGRLGRFFELVERFTAEIDKDPPPFGDAVERTHLAAALVGATAFYDAALPTLVAGLDPARSHAAHRETVLEIARRLLGPAPPAPPRR